MQALWIGAVVALLLVGFRKYKLHQRIKTLGEYCPEPPNAYHIPFGERLEDKSSENDY
jgi:hypothetical protein